MQTLISERELAKATGTSVRMWQDLRQHGGGPKYIRLSPRCIRYELEVVQAWLDQRTRSSVRVTARGRAGRSGGR